MLVRPQANFRSRRQGCRNFERVQLLDPPSQGTDLRAEVSHLCAKPGFPLLPEHDRSGHQSVASLFDFTLGGSDIALSRMQVRDELIDGRMPQDSVLLRAAGYLERARKRHLQAGEIAARGRDLREHVDWHVRVLIA